MTWHPIETLTDFDRYVLMYTPIAALFTRPDPAVHGPDFRVSSRRYWTWATHWMPLPDPPEVGP